MFDILIYLFESYFVVGSYPEHGKLGLKLTAAGFEDDDIQHALAWLSGLRQLTVAEYPDAINQSGFRTFADIELARISFDGIQFIVFLEANKIISPVEREMIIDRAVAIGIESVSLDNIKLITLMVLWNQHPDLDPVLIEDLLTPSNISRVH
jgi:Smg protein